MSRTVIGVCGCIAFTLCLGVLAAAQGQPPAAPPPQGRAGGPAPAQGGFVAYPQRPVTDPAAVERGKGLFSVNCAFCHGQDARGGDQGPNLMRTDSVLTDEKGERIGPIVIGGRPAKGMPPFMLTPAQVADVAAFLHSLPVSSRTGDRVVDIVVGDANAGERLFGQRCASCHTASNTLKGVASKYTDPKLLQQTWLMPGTGGTRGGGQPRPAPPVIAVVTLANGEKVQGTLSRIDDFVVSLTLADGTHRAFRTTGSNPPKVELRDPLRGHKDLLPTYSDPDIHNLTAYLVTLK